MALINGTAKDDVLASLPGLDTVSGMAGNDVLLVSLDADHPAGEKLDGGTGYDRLWFGSSGGTDTLLLRSTDVGIESFQAATAVGNWTVTDNVGIDATAITVAVTLLGNNGDNFLTGTKQADTIIGLGGADSISGGLGADRIVMDLASADSIDGGAVTELNTLVLFGSATNPITIDLSAAAGADQVTATGDGDTQKGFANVDASAVINSGIIVTGSAQKNLIGGTGQNDIFLYNSQAALNGDVVSGGGGDDVLRFTSTIDGAMLALTKTIDVEQVEIADATGLTTGLSKLGVNAAAATSAVTLVGNDGINTLTGSAFDDTINGNGGADSLAGGKGNDLYVVDDTADWSASDAITDASGTDDRIVVTATSAGTLTLGAGKITGVEAIYLSDIAFNATGTTALNVDGSAQAKGIDVIGNDGDNTLQGGKGNDTFESHAGVDSIVGNAGADVVIFDVGADQASVNAGAAAEGNKLKLVGTMTAQLKVDLSQGVDTLSGFQDQFLSDAVGNHTQSGFANVDASELNGGTGGVAVTLSTLANTIVGSNIDDLIIADSPAQLGATDSINGGNGNDTLIFASTTAGQTLAIGAKVVGVETAEIADATGLTTGTTSLNLTATAASRAFALTGNDGANSITGSKFNDTIVGNLGADTLQGGLGDDDYLYHRGTEFAAGEKIVDAGGNDTVTFLSTTALDILTLSNVTGVENYVLDATGTVDFGIDLSLITTAANVVGNDFGNAITGTSKNDTIDGGKGSDNIIGLAGNDNLFGGDDADTIDGGAGNDYIEAGKGLDSVTGGLGNDTIRISVEAGDSDSVDAGAISATEKNLLVLVGKLPTFTGVTVDLSSTVDQTDLAGTQTGFYTVNASQLSGQDHGDGVYVTGSTRAESIVGSSLNDVFDGGGGADTIDGGGEGDAYFVFSLTQMNSEVINDTGGTVGDHLILEFAGSNANITFLPSMKIDGIDGADCGFTAGNMSLNASQMDRPFSLSGNAGNNTLIGTDNGESFFDDGGGSDLIKGGNGADDYVISSLWVATSPGAGDHIQDLGDVGRDDMYYAYSGADTLVVTNANVQGIELFAVSFASLNIDGPNAPDTQYIRDIRSLNDAGFDLSGYGVAGKSYHLAGSFGNNTLIGTNFNDVIIGWGGTDSIKGGTGADTITMDIGKDTLGDASIDDIDAGALTEGNLLILVQAPDGVVQIDLSSTTDQIVAIDAAAETQVQKGFRDLDASGMKRPDGALATDHYGVFVTGSTVANKITGTNDNDTIGGGGGADILSAGAGDDALVFNSTAEYSAAASIDGGGGNDTLIFASTTAGQTFAPSDTKALSIEKIIIATATGDATGTTALNVNGVGFKTALEITGNKGANSLAGTALNDTLNGGGADTSVGGSDTLSGGAGNDVFLVKLGSDVTPGESIAGGAGTDTILFDSTSAVGPDKLLVLGAATTGVENIVVSEGADTLVGPLALDVDASAMTSGVFMTGNSLANVLTGTSAGDNIDGGLGNDTVNGGGGGDVIHMSTVAADMDDVDGGAMAEGNALMLSGDPGGAMVWDLTNAANQLIDITGLGIGGHTVKNISSIDFSALAGSNGVTVTGSADANILVGTANDDLFFSGSVFVAGDAIAAGDGSDVLRYNPGAPTTLVLDPKIFSGFESVQFADITGDTSGTVNLNVTAAAYKTALRIDGNNGNNSIVGTAFNDTINSGDGVDTIVAGAGADRVTLDVTFAGDSINGGAIGEGNSLVLIGGDGTNLTFDLGATNQMAVGGGTVKGFVDLDASGMSGVGSLVVTGTAAANHLAGTINIDTISGGAGADTIGMDVTTSTDLLNGGAITEGNMLALTGTATGTVVMDLTQADQLSSINGAADTMGQAGFLHVDASTLAGAGVDVLGTAAGNSIAGSAQADTVDGGLGADTISFDVAGGADSLDGGAGGEGDLLVLTGDAAATVNVDLSVAVGADQVTNVAGTQSDFQGVDASALGLHGVNVVGNGLDNRLVGSAFNDTLEGGGGADTFVLGDGTDRVVYRQPGDGATAAAAAAAFDRIQGFTAGNDEFAFGGDFNTAGSAYNLDDMTDNNILTFAVNQKADLAHTQEALLITSDKSGIHAEGGLTTGNLGAVVTAINKFGVVSGYGDDGLILVQMHGGTAAAPIDRTGIYYYQESDGIVNKVSAGELVLLGVVDAKITGDDVTLI